MFHCRDHIMMATRIMCAGKSELCNVKEKIKGLDDKIAVLERLPVGDPERQRLAGLEQRLAALEQRLAELQRKENILLEQSKGGQQVGT